MEKKITEAMRLSIIKMLPLMEGYENLLYKRKRTLNKLVKYDLRHTLSNVILAKVAVDHEGYYWINKSSTKRVIDEWEFYGTKEQFTIQFNEWSQQGVKITPIIKKGISTGIVSATQQEMNEMLEILRQSELEHKQQNEENPDDKPQLHQCPKQTRHQR